MHLKARPGLSEWRIDPDVFLEWRGKRTCDRETDCPASCPACTPSQQERQWMHLERSMRVFPRIWTAGASSSPCWSS